MENIRIPGDERKYSNFQPHATKSLALCSKKRPESPAMKSAWAWLLLLLWRAESRASKLTGHVGGPRNEITVTEPEALQVLQLINFLQLQAHWPLNSIKPARTRLLRPCSFFRSVQHLGEPGDVTSFPDRTAQEVTAGPPRFLPRSSLQVSFGLWNSKWLCYAVRNLCQNCVRTPLAIPSSLSLAQGSRPVCSSASTFDSF